MGINEIIQVGNQIKEIRKLLGFTQKEIALRAGIPYTTYSNYENNNREPNSEQLRKITNALNVPLSVLIENNELSRNYRSRLREYNDIKKSTSYSAEYKQQILEQYDSELERIKKELEIGDKQREEATKKAPKWNGKPPIFTDRSTSWEEAQAREKLCDLLDSIFNEESLSLEREKIALQLGEILTSYDGLNEIGRKTAVECIKELGYSNAMTESRLDTIYFNRIRKKIENGEALTSEEIEWKYAYLEKSLKTIGDDFGIFYSMLNRKGQEQAYIKIDQALAQIIALTEIPEYQKKPDEPPQD